LKIYQKAVQLVKQWLHTSQRNKLPLAAIWPHVPLQGRACASMNCIDWQTSATTARPLHRQQHASALQSELQRANLNSPFLLKMRRFQI
jgi:hypothetical protein